MSSFVSLIVIHAAFKSGTNYKPQKILEDWKNWMKKKETKSFVIHNVEISSDDHGYGFNENSE